VYGYLNGLPLMYIYTNMGLLQVLIDLLVNYQYHLNVMGVSVIIFDCDGVMFDSRKANVNFYNHILSHFGLPPLSDQDVDFVHMHTVVESLNHIFRDTPYAARAQEYRLRLDYAPFIKDMLIEPDLRSVLDFLKPNYGLAVATNRSNTIGKVLDSNGLSHYFDIVISSLDVKNPKPHPESIFKILQFFGVKPEDCVFIGDSEVDCELCQAAGVPFIAHQNKSLKAYRHIERLSELKKIFSFSWGWLFILIVF
jgi:phosphoglycolate phosphatase